MLRTHIQADGPAWKGQLPAAELAYNCAVHSSTRMTPFETMISENPLRAIDLELNKAMKPTVTPPMTQIFQRLVDRAAAHNLQAQAPQKHYADQKRKEAEFQVGKQVWVCSGFMKPRGFSKLQPRPIGPFKSVQRIGKLAYQLGLPPSMQQHPVLHASLYRKTGPGQRKCSQARLGTRLINYKDTKNRTMKWSIFWVAEELEIKRSF